MNELRKADEILAKPENAEPMTDVLGGIIEPGNLIAVCGQVSHRSTTEEHYIVYFGILSAYLTGLIYQSGFINENVSAGNPFKGKKSCMWPQFEA
jgi:hypothetical protein